MSNTGSVAALPPPHCNAGCADTDTTQTLHACVHAQGTDTNAAFKINGDSPASSTGRSVASDSSQRLKRRLHSISSAAIVDQPVSPFRRTAGTDRSLFIETMKKGVSGVPRIGIVTRRHSRKNKFVNFIGEYHLDLVQHFGAAPIIIPRTEYTAEHLQAYMPLDGLVIVEGEDIGPEYNPYGLEDDALGFQRRASAADSFEKKLHSFPHLIAGGPSPSYSTAAADAPAALPVALLEKDVPVEAGHESETTIDRSKDRVEWLLLKECLRLGVPFLGICRGCQILNVMAGGSLYYGIESQVPGAIRHIDYNNYDDYRHKVYICPESPLATWYPDAASEDGVRRAYISVNSYHHQGVSALAPRFRPMCHSPDGLVEGFYDPATFAPNEGKFCIGLQFHPERMLNDSTGAFTIYEDFITACWNYRRLSQMQSSLALQATALKDVLPHHVPLQAMPQPTEHQQAAVPQSPSKKLRGDVLPLVDDEDTAIVHVLNAVETNSVHSPIKGDCN